MKLAELKRYLLTVAHNLGDWRLDTRKEDYFYLLGEGMKICVYTKCYPRSAQGRLFFSGCLPRGYDGSRQTQSISISPTRKPLAAALDLRRRLLVDFNIELLDVHNHRKKKKYNEEQRQQLTHLISNVGYTGAWFNDWQRRGSLNLNVHGNDGVNSTFKVYAKGNSDVDISGLSPEQVIKLAYFLKEL